MTTNPIKADQKRYYNSIVNHPLQSYEWGEFREKTGIKVIRRGFFEKEKLIDAFQLTIHPIPYTKYTIGYLPKGKLPTNELIEELYIIGKQENCIFIQLEPNIKISNATFQMSNFKLLKQAAHPLFTKNTFMLDLTKSEQELLAGMHPKTRYNIRVAQKHGVVVAEDNSDEAFETYWKLTEETTKRQKFYAHTKFYHETQWKLFHHTTNTNELTSHLFTGKYDKKMLTTLMLFVFHDTLYYPYGASSNEARNVMHSTLTMWEVIRFGKRLGLKTFDMWGSLGENPDQTDPWFGFHRFKQGFGPELVEFVGSYDLITNPLLYQLYKGADKLRWIYLKSKK